ncbi:MAG: hypothetical protein WCF67_15780 [Chitinophagaceae bacterium]
MALNNPLLVPVEVDAFVMNDNVLKNKGTNIQRWHYAYAFLENYVSPQPEPFNGTNDLPGTGVMLHWTLPDVLRRGQAVKSGDVTFPFVPNRWLVVRYSGPVTARTAVAWIVQSDALGNSDRATGGAAYMQPGTTTVKPTFTGQVVSLTNWKEPDPPSLFLTAVAPGNKMFAAFQPYCQNVFSIYDPLTGVAAQDTLSYFVAGWYSKQDADIIGSWQGKCSFDDFLQTASWERAAGTDTATWGIYHGMKYGISWDMNGAAPNNTPPGSSVKVALGNTTVDALTAMIKSQVAGMGDIDPDLLEALQYGLLPGYDMPDAQYNLKQQIEESWFGSKYGGYQWEVVNKPVDAQDGNPPPAVSAQELAVEQAWLAELNKQQLVYDTAMRELTDMQWQLYQVWWKYNFAQANALVHPYPDGTSQDEFTGSFNTGNPDSLISKVHAQQQFISELSGRIPVGATQQALQDRITEYAKSVKLPATRELKQFARRPYTNAYEPVVLMQGLKTETTLRPTEKLVCRFMSELVAGFYYPTGTKTNQLKLAQVQGAIPIPQNIGVLPAQLQDLLHEFFLLDPGNATMIAKAAFNSTDAALIIQLANAITGGNNVSAGVCPDFTLTAWKQPWVPLVLLWDIVWYPIKYQNDNNKLWKFNGNEYTWNGTGFDVKDPTWGYQGMIFMTPQASFNFRVQMEKFIKDNPENEEMKELEAFIKDTDKWDFLSQSFAGISKMMTLRDTNPNISPSLDPTMYFPEKKLANLVGSSATYAPSPGTPQPPPFKDWPPSGFQEWRAGQFYIRRLTAVDKFGQTCEIVTSETQLNFKPVLAPSLQPQFPVIPQEANRFIQLAPRLLQPARLNLDFVSCADDNNILGLSPGTNPVCAWLLHNYLDESIACYNNQGYILGSVWIITNEKQEQVVNWTAAPGSPFATVNDMINNAKYPDVQHLGEMLLAMKDLGPAAFNSMIETLDKAAVTIDSDAASTDISMMLLAGRPVAMVRLRLQFELEGPVVSDPSWRFTFKPSPNAVTGWSFNVRMGESGQRSDGLVGYFSGKNYKQFFTPNMPDHLLDPAYILPVADGSSIQLPFDNKTAAFLTVLMDPRTLIHATTGIVPVVEIGIPQAFTGSSFAKMDLTFNVGPMLSNTVTPAKENSKPSVVMPRPSLKNGTWSWQQLEVKDWATYDITPAVPTAQFSNVQPILRQGLLRLAGSQNEKDAQIV